MGDHTATPPERWVCAACGKTSATRYGLTADHSPGWDESCMINAVLCRPVTEAERKDKPSLRWHAVEEQPE